MKINIYPGAVKGRVNAPISKSHFIRLIASAILAENNTEITFSGPLNFLPDDINVALNIASCLGSEIKIGENHLLIVPPIKNSAEFLSIDCGESGLCMRLLPLLALNIAEQIRVNANGSLLKRPVNYDINVLNNLGIDYSDSACFPPFYLKKVRLPEAGTGLKLNASQGSQFLSGLLTFLPLLRYDSSIEVSGLVSKPYIEMTIRTLEKFSINIIDKNYSYFIPGGQKYISGEMKVEADWSGAAFMAVAGAIAGDMVINGLDINSSQADKAILRVLKLAGANFSFKNNSLKIARYELNPFQFDATDCPDLFPPLVALAFNCEGISVIKGAGRLIHKESNRAMALQEEFAKLGGKIEIKDDNMLIYPSDLSGGEVDSHGDHRIAMALAVAALNAKSPVTINGSESVTKSYPSFFDDFPRIVLND